MKRLFICLMLVAVYGLCDAMPTVEWQTLGNSVDADGKPYYTQRFTIKGALGLRHICFNQFARHMATVNPADTIREIIPGYYRISTAGLQEAGEAVVDIITAGTLRHHSYMPDGVHGVTPDGTPVAVRFTRRSISDTPGQWSLPGSDRSPRPADIYRLNESLSGGKAPGAFDIIPSFKSVKLSGGGVVRLASAPRERLIDSDNPERYTITLAGDSAVIGYASPRARRLARAALSQLQAVNPDGIPAATIEDWPDYPYRGLMIDIARNFMGIPQLQMIAQTMARYRMNKLHLHFADDEAWRLEIPGLPELTDVGARRGYTLDEDNYLAQIFAGNGNPDATRGTANGYISRSEFIQFIRYCHSLGIDLIPEIESPGHARAAIKSMRHRYRHKADSSYLLVEEGDTSSYTSAQSFHDNVMNPALPGTYRFMGKVIAEIDSMYREAGVPLVALHIGGDEVPVEAWGGSPKAQAMIKELNLDGERGLHAAFVESIADTLSRRGIAMNGWQEIAVGHSPGYNRKIAPLTGGVNFWRESRRSEAPAAALAGYPVIVCNVDHFYLDQAYTSHPDEQGLTWGGNVDEFATLEGYPGELCKVNPVVMKNVIGVSGQLFSETIRDFSQIQRYLFPKMLGLAERGWNGSPTYTRRDFNRLIAERELQSMALRGVDFHLRQPGVKVEGGRLLMNSPYAAAVIRYTLDGSNPDGNSPIYTGPLVDDGASPVRASLFYLGKQSAPTILIRQNDEYNNQ